MTTNLKKVSVNEAIDKLDTRSTKVKKEVKQQKEVKQEEIDLDKYYKKSEFDNKDIDSHPVLKKLKAKLGLRPLEIYTKSIIVDCDKIDFSFSEYSEELVIFCASEYKSNSIMDEHLSLKKFDILRIGCSLVAIDGYPIYEVFGIELELEELERVQKNKFDVSNRVRKECAKRFCQKVLIEYRGFISELEEFFIEKIVNISNIKAFDSLKEGQKVFVCDVPGCTFVHKDYPMEDNGKEIPFMCTIHATPLKQALTKKEKSDLPLA